MTQRRSDCGLSRRFQSTQPSQAVTAEPCVMALFLFISIHTALAGCDVCRNRVENYIEISIHTALAGCDGPLHLANCAHLEFQSTQPSQAVTATFLALRFLISISIHTALAGCDYHLDNIIYLPWISIHTALAGCDSNNTQQKPHSNRHNHIQCIYI